MNKKNLLNILLVFVVAALAAVIYFSEEESTLLDQLTDTPPESVGKIKIQHNNHTTFINKRDDDQWVIVQPINIEANNFRISSILKLINAPVHNHYRLDEIDLGKTGLSDSGTHITLDDNSITFGNINPATGLRYIRFNDQVVTIEDVYHPLLSSHFSTLVSLNLLPTNNSITDGDITSGGIEKLILSNQTISKDDNGLWQSNTQRTADSVAKTLDHWQHDQAFGIHEYMERKQLGEIFIFIKGQRQPISYRITDTDPWLILARPEIGLEFHLDKEAYKNLIAPD